MINWLANPARFTRFSATALPWCGWAAAMVLAVGLLLVAGLVAAGLSAGRERADHVHPCPGGLDGVERLFASRRVERRGPRLAPSSRRDRRSRRRTDRRCLHLCLPRHRIALGAADVGHMVGMGRPAHFGADPVFSLSRVHRAGERLRRSVARRQGGVGARTGRGRQPADHQILRRLVEHACTSRRA